ncbi:MAG: hypothetical protein RI897_4258 [Verrucomicrobiota bacterium]
MLGLMRIPGYARVLCVLSLILLSSCQPQPPGSFSGYVEGEYVYVSAPSGGHLLRLLVNRGDAVTNQQSLFELDPQPESSGVQAATARLAQAEADLANRRKPLRESELRALETELERLSALRNLASNNLSRRLTAATQNSGAFSPEQLDEATSALAELEARMARSQAELDTARLGSRPDEIQLAQKMVEMRRHELEQANWALKQKQALAPADGRIEDTLYREGEWVPPNAPVLYLLPPENRIVRFFVSETQLHEFNVGTPVLISWDGAKLPAKGTVRFIASQAEYTPPVIYSRQTRSQLVFLLEAAFNPDQPDLPAVGQPVDVTPTIRP